MTLLGLSGKMYTTIQFNAEEKAETLDLAW